MAENNYDDLREDELIVDSARSDMEAFDRFLPLADFLTKDFSASLVNYFAVSIIYRLVFVAMFFLVFWGKIPTSPIFLMVPSAALTLSWVLSTIGISSRTENTRKILFGVAGLSGRSRWSDEYVFLFSRVREDARRRIIRLFWLFEPIFWLLLLWAIVFNAQVNPDLFNMGVNGAGVMSGGGGGSF